jgi:hypothetical protein
MKAVVFNFWSIALLGVGASAYTRRAHALAAVCALLFVPVASLGTIELYSEHSLVATWGILTLGIGPGLLGYLLYCIDRRFACFTTEMTYATLPASILWPLVALANCVGLLL